MSFLRGLRLAGFARRHLGRMSRGRREVMKHLAAPGRSLPPLPTFVQLRLTNLCNLRCAMCGQWGDTGVFRDPAADLGVKNQLSLSDYVRLLDELAPGRPIVSLFGGEPLLYPDVVPLVREVKARGLPCSIITNGWRLAELAEELVDAGLDSVLVSIDGPPEVHDRIRGREGSFERAAEGIRAMARRRSARGSAAPMLLAMLPVTELNLADIEPALAALRELPLDTVNVGLRWFVPRETGAEYEAVMGGTFGVTGESWKGFEFDGRAMASTKGRELQQLVKLLSRQRRRRFMDAALGRPWTSFVPELAPADVPRYFAEPAEMFGHDLCPAAWYFAQIEPDGGVCFCGDFPDYIIGSVREAPFREVWYGEKAVRFREKLAREPLPVCARCCGSLVYGRWRRPTDDPG